MAHPPVAPVNPGGLTHDQLFDSMIDCIKQMKRSRYYMGRGSIVGESRRRYKVASEWLEELIAETDRRTLDTPTHGM